VIYADFSSDVRRRRRLPLRPVNRTGPPGCVRDCTRFPYPGPRASARCHARGVPESACDRSEAGQPRPGPLRNRYADAVRERRAELRGARSLLVGGHRAELRSGLAAARLAASAELATALAALDRELRHHADHADRAGRAALPEMVPAAVDRLLDHAAGRWAATVLPALRCVATVRGLRPPLPWPGGRATTDRVTAALRCRPMVALPALDPPPTVVRALLAGATEGMWRLALLPAAALSAVGLSALGGRSTVPFALGLGLALLLVAVRARRVAADRARLRRWGTEVTATVRGALETELSRRLLEVERHAGAELDDAAVRRRTEIDAELRALAPEPVGKAGG